MWLVFALLSAFFNSLMDLFTKFASGRINVGIGATLICFFAAIPTLIYSIITKLSGQDITYSKEGILFSALAGLTVGIATIFSLKMFASGINLSVAVPIFRISMIIIGCFLGIVLLKENVSWKLVLGILFSFIGMYLIINSKT